MVRPEYRETRERGGGRWWPDPTWGPEDRSTWGRAMLGLRGWKALRQRLKGEGEDISDYFSYLARLSWAKRKPGLAPWYRGEVGPGRELRARRG